MRTKCHRILIALLLAFIVDAAVPLMRVQAEVPYSTFSKDSYGRTVYTQPAYAPEETIGLDVYLTGDNGERIYSPLKSPQDLYIDSKDEIYVADTGNNRIVHFNANSEFVREIVIPENPFNQPKGIFVTEKGIIYVADTGNKRVVMLGADGTFIKEYKRPDSVFIQDDFVYEPINMVVDQRGFLYIISSGSYQGIVQLDPDGKFYGFYGTNITEVSFMDRLRRALYTKEQQSRQISLLPATLRNIEIDNRGYIYTVSAISNEQIKKLNIRGDNIWKGLAFGERAPGWIIKESQKAALIDVAVDSSGFVTAIDKGNNTILQYDQDGQLLFYWVGPSSIGRPQVGLNQSPVAIAANSKNKLYVLDDFLNLIQVFSPTEFGAAVHAAHEGNYEASEELWQRVIKLNAMYSPAYKGLAQAAYFRKDYERAKEMYKIAGNAAGVSNAFWQIRLQWFQRNFAKFVNIAIALLLVWFISKFIMRRLNIHWRKPRASKKPLFILDQQLRQSFRILVHPIDGFSELRYSEKGSYLSAVILLVLAGISLLVKTYSTSFSFSPLPVEDRDGSSMLIVGGAIWLSWVICNYLIGSIRRGEARFKDVFVGCSYALFPLILIGMPLSLLSNVMTLSEQSIYAFFNSMIVIWILLLLYWKIQSLQNYSVGETAGVMLLTPFAMIVLWVIIFTIMGMSTELFNFVYAFYKEVSM